MKVIVYLIWLLAGLYVGGYVAILISESVWVEILLGMVGCTIAALIYSGLSKYIKWFKL